MTDYGIDCYTGKEIIPPKGWRILPEGIYVPQGHREYTQVLSDRPGGWADYRRCHSTMTPITARVWGSVRAIAVPKEIEGETMEIGDRVKNISGICGTILCIAEDSKRRLWYSVKYDTDPHRVFLNKETSITKIESPGPVMVETKFYLSKITGKIVEKKTHPQDVLIGSVMRDGSCHILNSDMIKK